MNDNKEKKTEEVINYQFVAAPTKLMYICDPYTFKLLTYLIERESYWKTKKRLSSGYLFISIEEIGELLDITNRKDIRCVIEGLYRTRLIDVKCSGIGKGKKNKLSNQFKINWNLIERIDKMPFDEIQMEKRITKLSRTEKITYDKLDTGLSTSLSTNCTTTLEEPKELKDINNIIITSNNNIIIENFPQKDNHDFKFDNKNNLIIDNNNLNNRDNKDADKSILGQFEKRGNSIQQDIKVSENASKEAKNTLSNKNSDIEEFYERETDRMLDEYQTLEDFTVDYQKVLSQLSGNYPQELSAKYINQLKIMYIRTLKRLAGTPETGIPTSKIEKVLEGTGLKDLYNSLVA